MELYIMLPLGLGDCLISCGLIRHKAKEYDKVFIPCWQHNMPSVQFMFSDAPNVIVQPVFNPNDIFIQQVQHEASGTKVLKLGTYSGETQLGAETFDQTFYRQAGVDFSRRWDGFKIPEVKQVPPFVPAPLGFAFICDSEERGFLIDDAKIPNDVLKIRPWKAQRIFDFIPLISQATEIHCINSAFSILADSIPTNGKLFMHRYARPFTPYDNFKLRKDWKILD